MNKDLLKTIFNGVAVASGVAALGISGLQKES